jgi:hypothetical protein
MNAETRAVITANTFAAETAIRASADALDVDLCKARVVAVEQARAAAITSAKPAAAMKAESALMAARITLEIAVARAKASTDEHAEAVKAAKVEQIAKAQRAAAVIDSEMVAMAAEFSQALDAALKIGERLQDLASRNLLNVPVNVSLPPVPPAVVEALKRMPPLDPFNTPVHILRNGGISSDAWSRRFAELTDVAA